MNEICTTYYKVAGTVFSVTADPALEHPYLKDFRRESSDLCELSFTVDGNVEDVPSCSGQNIYHSDIIDIMLSDSDYRLSCVNSACTIVCDYKTGLHTASVHLSPAKESLNFKEEFTVTDYLFFIIKEVFFAHCQQKGMLPIHSSSVVLDGCAYLFSAPSGTGKTTHTEFWCDLFGAEILDGDVTMLSIEGELVYAHGMPWCGTSAKYMNASFPLGSIIFLSRSASNSIGESDTFSSVIGLSSRSFAPNWTRELAAKTLEISKKIVELSPCLQLKCLPNPESAKVAKEYIYAKKQV